MSITIDDMITLTSDGWQIKKSCNELYIKDIEKPTLPFVFNK